MKILFVTSEATPYFSTGGLGDVSGSLPRALKRTCGDADVRVVMPLYKAVKVTLDAETVYEGRVRLGWRDQYLGIRRIVSDGVVFYFIDNDYYFGRDFAYGNYDDGERFAYFGKAVCELTAALGFFPDVLHANDWQSALSVIYVKLCHGGDERYSGARTVFTVHNAEYQGKYDPLILGDVFGLPEECLPAVEYDGAINLLKGAAFLADRVTTVSVTYARELSDGYYSAGLHSFFREISFKTRGIVNGIDVERFDPSTDGTIAANYSSRELSGKGTCRRELIKSLSLEVDDNTPIVAVVSRLVPHKGMDLIVRVLDEVVSQGTAVFAILGTGYPEYEYFFRSAAERHPGRVAAEIRFDPVLARRIYAGADIFLMPSKCEPCGLSQMIASRYGAIPLVRETGGLSETVVPYNEFTGEGTGFSFKNYNAHEMKSVLEYAASVFSRRETWDAIVRSAMEKDFSWDRSALKYMELYRDLTENG